MALEPYTTTSAAEEAMLQNLPNDIISKIADACVVAGSNTDTQFNEPVTHVRAAAACMMAAQCLRGLGMEVYRTVLKQHGYPDVSLACTVTAAHTVKQIKEVLQALQLTRSGRKAELLARLQEAYQEHCPVKECHRGQLLGCSRLALRKYIRLLQSGKQALGLWAAQRQCITTHGSVDACLDVFAQLLAKEKAQRMQLLREQEERRHDLTARLQARGCELHSDSRLCEAYISCGYGDVDNIVDTMEAMRLFYQQTRYSAHFSRIKEQIIDDWVHVDMDLISSRAKKEALQEWLGANGGHRDQLPRSLQ
jgi:hypothetical protein